MKSRTDLVSGSEKAKEPFYEEIIKKKLVDGDYRINFGAWVRRGTDLAEEPVKIAVQIYSLTTLGGWRCEKAWKNIH